MAKQTIKAMRAELVSQHGYTDAEAKQLKDAASLEEALSMAAMSVAVDTVTEVAVDELAVTEVQTHEQTLMDQLDTHEIVNGYPTTSGLRRLCNDLYTITTIDTDVVQVGHMPDGGVAATLKVTVILDNGKRFSGVADSCSQFLQTPFDKHVVATVETKAEGRALRRALMMGSLNTYEEIIGGDDAGMAATGGDDAKKISRAQLSAMSKVGKKHDINVMEVVNGVNKDWDSIGELSFSDATRVLSNMHTISKDGVSEALSGYDKNWSKQ